MPIELKAYKATTDVVYVQETECTHVHEAITLDCDYANLHKVKTTMICKMSLKYPCTTDLKTLCDTTS